MIKTQRHSISPTPRSATPLTPLSPPKQATKKFALNNFQKENLSHHELFKPASAANQVSTDTFERKIADVNGRRLGPTHQSKLNLTHRQTIDRIPQQDASQERSKSKSIKSQRRFEDKKIPGLCLNTSLRLPEAGTLSQTLTRYPISSNQLRPLKSDRRTTEQIGSKTIYNYTHNISSDVSESNIGSSTNRRQKEAEYHLKRRHIETMHQQIGDLLKVVKQNRDERKIETTDDQPRKRKQKTELDKPIKFHEVERSCLKSYAKMEESEIVYSLEQARQAYLPSATPIQRGNRDRQIYEDFLNQYRLQKAREVPTEQNTHHYLDQKQITYSYANKVEQRAYEELKPDRYHNQLTERLKQSQREMLTSRRLEPQIIKNDIQIKETKIKTEWVGIQEADSQYVDAIDKEISKIKERILNSERVTKQMENKYLGLTYRDVKESHLVQNDLHPMFTPLKQQSSQQTQLQNIPEITGIPTHRQVYPQVQQFGSSFPKGDQALFDEIRDNLALSLAKQVEIDLEMRKWREHIMDAVRHQKGKVSLWAQVCRKLSVLGQPYTQHQIINLLQINSCESNPFLEPTTQGGTPSPKNIVQNLTNLFIESQQFWNTKIIGSIRKQQADSCCFSVSVLDLNKKGFISIEDMVCFVNLYAGKFYRSRDFMMVSRRILTDSRGGGIEYQELEAILFDKVEFVQ